MKRAKPILEKVAEIGFSDLEQEWKRIKEIQNIRNLIAHNSSNVIKNHSRPIEEQPFYQLVKNEQFIDLNEQFGEFFIEDKRFINDVVDIMQICLFSIIDKVSRVKVKAQNMSFRYDMANWGDEKTETLLKEVIHGLDMLDNYEKREDKHRLDDLLNNIRNLIGGMSWNLTKLYSFFSNGTWDVKDKDLIIEEREEGLEKLKKYYEN